MNADIPQTSTHLCLISIRKCCPTICGNHSPFAVFNTQINTHIRRRLRLKILTTSIAMPKATGFKPHPAFDTNLLPLKEFDYPTNARKGHYPSNYLSSIKDHPQTVDALYDIGGYFVTKIIAVSSFLVALLRPLWVLDTPELNLSAFVERPRETIFLRRALLLESVHWIHGLTMAYVCHLRSILTNHDELQMVQPMLGEYQSHRIHLLSFLQALKPSIFTRVLLIVIQAMIMPVYFLVCLVYPPLALSIARFVAAHATHFYSDTLTALEKGEMPRVAAMKIPPVAAWFYNLPAGARFRELLLNIRADDAFHSFYNEICLECQCDQPVLRMAKYLTSEDRGGKQ